MKRSGERETSPVAQFKRGGSIKKGCLIFSKRGNWGGKVCGVVCGCMRMGQWIGEIWMGLVDVKARLIEQTFKIKKE